jgi:hypothetical protein
MDAKQVESFCATAADLLVQVGAYAAIDAARRDAGDDAQVRRLRVVVAGLSVALDSLARLSPPPARARLGP